VAFIIVSSCQLLKVNFKTQDRGEGSLQSD
jgi:hypothetical protein